MHDGTETIRRQMVNEINSNPGERDELEKKHGQVWDTQELSRDFNVKGFVAPLVVVERKTDGVMGSLEFQHRPRYYFNWKEHK